METIKQIFKLGLENEFKDYLQNKLKNLFDYDITIININENKFMYEEGYFIEYCLVEDDYIQLMPDSVEHILSILDESVYFDICYKYRYDRYIERYMFDLSMVESDECDTDQIYLECQFTFNRNYQTKFKLEFNPVKESRKIKLESIFTENK